MKFNFDTMTPRERRLVQIGAVAAVLIIIFGVLLPLDSSVTKVRERITKKQADLLWMKNVAPVLAAQLPTHQPGGGGESLLVIVDRSVHESRIDKSVAGTEPGGPGAIQVRLEKAPFDAIVGWLSRLSQQNGLGVDGATLDTAGSAGVVNAAIVLHQQ
jgi:general secretion pathway protein M